MCLSLKQYLSVLYNAKVAIFLHVSASSEGQERRNETSVMMKKTEHHILIYNDACGPSRLCLSIV
jgi:hypothetical protein